MENVCLLKIDPSIENLGTRLKTLALKNFSFPKVHQNILGPGLAQVKLEKLQIGRSIDFPGPSFGLDKKPHE